MIVPPGTLARASAFTLAAASPLSSVSSLRCLPHGLWACGALFAAGVIAIDCQPPLDADDWLEPDPLAALATPYVPAASPTAIAPRTITRSSDHRLLFSIGYCSFLLLTAPSG